MIRPRPARPRKPRRRHSRLRLEALESRRLLATLFVDTTADNTAGICAADDAAGNDNCTLRLAVQEAEANPGPDTIQIADGTYVLDSAFGSIDLANAQDTSFIGTSNDPTAVIIDGDDQSRVFDIFGGVGVPYNVSFQGLTIRGGVASDGSGGGGINASSDVDLLLNNVTIQNNLAAENRLVLGQFSSGGGIQASGNVTINDSTIANNVATNEGGAIDFSPFGGGTKNLIINNSTISGNLAGDRAFDRGYGGGIIVDGADAVATLNTVSITGNSAGDSGGGIYTRRGSITTTDVTFTNNDALGSNSGGGGLYVFRGFFSVTGGSFASGSAVSGAGGFESFESGGTIDGSSFTLNQVTGPGTSFDQGGGAIAIIGIDSATSPEVTIRNASVTNNTAALAGGIASVEARLTIEDSTIAGNTATAAAGGIGVTGAGGAAVNILRSTIDGNTAGGDAGGIGALETDLFLQDTTVNGNQTSSGRGGGIGIQGQTRTPVLTAERTTISNNTASSDGGGIALDSAGIDLVNVTVSDNQSTTGSGGGISYDNVNDAITRSIFYSTIASNTAGALGSNIAALNTAINIEGSLFADGDGAAVAGIFNSLGGNLDSGTSMGFNQPSDLTNTDALLGTLADNGGFVLTRALAAGSPAIDAATNNAPTVDARGVTRPQDGNGDFVGVADIGALEFEMIVGPIASTPDLNASSDTGARDTDDITSDTTPSLSGTAEAGSTIELFDRILPVRRVTFDPAIDFLPAWDPASETIAFVTSRDPATGPVSNIGLVQSDGSGEMLGLSGPNSGFGVGASPSWVGSTGVLMVHKRFGLHEYVTFDAGLAPTTIFTTELFIPGGGGGGNVVVSRDGSTVLWRVSTSGGGGNISIRVAPFDTLTGQSAGTHGTLLQTSVATGSDPFFFDDGLGFALSPDGSQYAVAEEQPQAGGTFGYDLFLRSTVDGSLIRRLTTTGETLGGFNGQPDFSPDGSKIVFTRAIGSVGVDDLFEINVDGTGLTNLTNSGVRIRERMPSWSPEGGRLAYATPDTNASVSALPGETNNWNVYVIEGLDAIQPPGASLGTTTANASGDWSIDVGPLAEGRHEITAIATDGGGAAGPLSTPLSLLIDATAPAAPTTPDLNDASDTGSSNSDDITSDTTPTFDGTAEAGSTLELFDDATSLGTTATATPIFNDGDYLVVDQDALGGGGALLAIDPVTGAQTVISSGDNFVDPAEVLVTADGSIYVTDQGAQAVIQIDPFTGAQTVISTGGLLQNPLDLVAESNGDLLVTDSVAAAVIRIDPTSGNQTVVSTGDNISAAGLRGIAQDPVGNILVTDSVNDLLIRIDPATGVQTVVSAGGSFFDPRGITVTEAGTILIADRSAFAGMTGGIIEVDAATGVQSTRAGGGDFQDPFDVIVNDVGDLIVADFTALALFRIDPTTQNTLSTGDNFVTPVSVAATRLPAGGWSLTSGALAGGVHNISAIATDLAGNASGASAPLAVTVNAPANLIVSDVFFEESAGDAMITVTLDSDVGGPFDVDFTTAAGTATDAGDFQASTGTLSFNGQAGEQQNILVAINNDNVAEQDEQFQVVLSNPTATVNTDDVGVISLFDDDTLTLTVDRLAEETEETGSIAFGITLTGDSDAPFTVDVATLDLAGEAVAGIDYSAAAETLTFAGNDGETQAFVVSVTPDAIVELDEEIGVEVSNISAGTRDVVFNNYADRIDVAELGQFVPGGISANDVALFTPDPLTTIAYVADDSGLLVLDVSDPAAVVQLGAFPLASPALDIDTVDVAFFSDVIYVAAGDAGLEILDVSDPANITRLGSFNAAGQRALSLAREGGTIFLGETDATSVGTLRILDASDPGNITELGVFRGNLAAVEDVVLDGTNAYVASSEGLEVIDVSNASNPVSLGGFAAREGTAVGIDGATVYLGTPTGLAMLDVSDPANITETGFFATPGAVATIDVDGNTVSITDQTGVIRILRTFSGVSEIGSFTFPTTALGFDIEGVTTYVATATGGVRIIEGDLVAVSDLLIANDDAATLSVSDAFAIESDGVATVVVSVDSAVDGGFTVDVSTADDSATDPDDYFQTTETLTFSGAAGQSIPFSVSIVEDADLEGTESFLVSLDNVVTLGNALASSIDALSIGTATIDDPPVAQVDLSTTVTDDSDPVDLGDSVTVTIPIDNFGPDVASNVFSTTTLPDEFTIDSATSDFFNATVEIVGNDVNVSIPALDGGVTATLTIVATAQSPGIVTTSTSVDSAEFELDDADNSDVETTEIVAPTDVDLSITSDNVDDRPAPGGTFFDSYTIDNNSTVDATNVVTEITLPAGVTFSAGTITGGTVVANGSVVTATIPLLGANQSANANLTLVVDDNVADGAALTSTALVSADQPELDPDDNDAESTDTVILQTATTIAGHVSCDINGNGIEDTGEAVVGTTVFLDEDGNRILDTGERSTLTDDSGDYSFDNVTDTSLTIVAQVPFNCDTIPFNPGIARSDIGVGALARSITSADVDGDGDRDIYVASEVSNSVTLLRNDEGEFSSAGEIILGDRPQSIFAWESPQLASPVIAVAGVGTAADGGSIYMMNGAPEVSQIEAGNGPIEVVLADFDNNGVVDIVSAAVRSSNLRLLLNGSSESTEIATARLVRTVEAGDVNGDGSSDIVVGGYGYPGDDASELVVRLGDGAGGFADPISTDPIQKLVSVKIAPLTDGPDPSDVRILALSEAGRLYIYALQAGELVEENSIEVAAGSTSFDVGDFNRDGLTDLAIANLGSQLIDLLVGNGGGRFAPVTTITNVPAPSDVVVDDFDNDGADDIAVANLYHDNNLGQPGSPDFRFPSTTTILRLDVAESSFVVSGGTVSEVNFEFQSADPEIRLDVSGEGEVSAVDALRVINAMRRISAAKAGLSAVRESTDVNGDGRTSAVDALMIINYMATQEVTEAPVAGLEQLSSDDDDEEDRFTAIDVVLTQTLT